MTKVAYGVALQSQHTIDSADVPTKDGWSIILILLTEIFHFFIYAGAVNYKGWEEHLFGRREGLSN